MYCKVCFYCIFLKFFWIGVKLMGIKCNFFLENIGLVNKKGFVIKRVLFFLFNILDDVDNVLGCIYCINNLVDEVGFV